jgi:hypothetical protein
MIERLPSSSRLTWYVTPARSAERLAQDALDLVSSGRPQAALALLERLPAMIAAEIDAAGNDGHAEGYQRGLREVTATIPTRSGPGTLKQPGWLLDALTDPAKFAAIAAATELQPGQLRAIGHGRASLGPGMLARAKAAIAP